VFSGGNRVFAASAVNFSQGKSGTEHRLALLFGDLMDAKKN
jgi:hypothetical protein